MEAAALATGEKGLEELYAKLKPFVEAHANALLGNLVSEADKLIQAKLAAKHSMFTGMELRGAEVALSIIDEALGNNAATSTSTPQAK